MAISLDGAYLNVALQGAKGWGEWVLGVDEQGRHPDPGCGFL
jgi:hypothetical protein